MTTRSSKILRSSAAALLVACVTSTVHAEPSPADIESARALYVEGLELRDKGDLAVSLTRFHDAHALAATPITTLELGRALAMVGRLLEAREMLLSAERLPVRSDESQKAAHARVEARMLAEQLKARIPAVQLRFSPPTTEPPRVTIDGAPVPPEALATARKLDPGKHTIVAELDGARASADISLAESTSQSVTLVLAPTPPSMPVGGPARAASVQADTREIPSAPPPSTAGSDSGAGPWFYGGLAAAGAGVLVGSISGILAFTTAGPLASQCTGPHCARSAEGDLSTSRMMGNVATIGFCVAGAGVAIAVAAWILKPDSVRSTSRALRWTW